MGIQVTVRRGPWIEPKEAAMIVRGGLKEMHHIHLFVVGEEDEEVSKVIVADNGIRTGNLVTWIMGEQLSEQRRE